MIIKKTDILAFSGIYDIYHEHFNKGIEWFPQCRPSKSVMIRLLRYKGCTKHNHVPLKYIMILTNLMSIVMSIVSQSCI